VPRPRSASAGASRASHGGREARDAPALADDSVTATVDDAREIRLELPLTPGERTVLAAGGLLAHVRAGGRARVPTP